MADPLFSGAPISTNVIDQRPNADPGFENDRVNAVMKRTLLRPPVAPDMYRDDVSLDSILSSVLHRNRADEDVPNPLLTSVRDYVLNMKPPNMRQRLQGSGFYTGP